MAGACGRSGRCEGQRAYIFTWLRMSLQSQGKTELTRRMPSQLCERGGRQQ